MHNTISSKGRFQGDSPQTQSATTPGTGAGRATTPITESYARLDNARILRLKQVIAIVGLGKSSIYGKIQEGAFPPPIKLGTNASGWISTEIHEWIEAQIRRCRKPELPLR